MAEILREVEFRLRRNAEGLFGKTMGLGDVKRLLEVAEFEGSSKLNAGSVLDVFGQSDGMLKLYLELDGLKRSQDLRKVKLAAGEEVLGQSRLGWSKFNWVVRMAEADTTQGDLTGWLGVVNFRGADKDNLVDLAVCRHGNSWHLGFFAQERRPFRNPPISIYKSWESSVQMGVRWERRYVERLSLAAGFGQGDWISRLLLGPLAQYLRLQVK